MRPLFGYCGPLLQVEWGSSHDFALDHLARYSPATTLSRIDVWFFEHLFILYGALAESQKFLTTFTDFPPRQKPNSFSIDQIAERLMNYENMTYR